MKTTQEAVAPKAVAPRRRAGSKSARYRETPEVRRRLLIEATTRSIARFGYSGTTIERICSEGGVSRGLINHHFGSKDELILQSYSQLCEAWAQYTLEGMKDSQDPGEALRDAIDRNFDPKMFHPDSLRIWLGFWSVIPKSPKLKKLDGALYRLDMEIFQQVFERLGKKKKIRIDSRLQAISLMALIQGLWLQWALDPKSFSAEEAKAVCLASVEHLLA
jgi:AcrR family transcriptional regulator